VRKASEDFFLGEIITEMSIDACFDFAAKVVLSSQV
jgi:hypothetical protein